MTHDVPAPVSLRSRGLYLLWASAVLMAVVGALAALTHQPWVFPSLGPTAYVLLAAPYAAESSPRNAVLGHGIGILAGALAVTVLGLYGVPADLEDVTPARTAAVVVSLALTLAAMTWLGFPHAPAGATTLIVALGLLRTPEHWLLMLVSVIALVATGWGVNRLRGEHPPVWGPQASA